MTTKDLLEENINRIIFRCDYVMLKDESEREKLTAYVEPIVEYIEKVTEELEEEIGKQYFKDGYKMGSKEYKELEASIRKEVVNYIPEERKETGRTLNEMGEIFGHNMCRLEFLKRLE